jgi:transmembrane sensor
MENSNAHDLHLLLEKYINNTCSKEELEQVLKLAEEKPAELYPALEKQWFNTSKVNEVDKKHWDSLYASMLAETETIENDKVARPITGRRGRIVPMMRMAVAAVFVLALFITAFFIYRKGEHALATNTPKKGIQNDVGPGGDKAVLTLADGRKIILDTASNGALVQQGGIKVIKTGGQVSYNADTKSTVVLYNMITTPRGGQYQLQLADGTKVWLNAASSLRFPMAFAGKERSVELTGEAYFEVVHNAAQPFHVKAGDVDVQDLGTEFDVNAYSDEPDVKATLVQGRVNVKREGNHVFLNPGQQAKVLKGVDDIRIDYDVDLEEVVAWKNGRFLFNGAGIESIMRQVERWYDVQVVYEGKPAGLISGSLPRAVNVSQVLKILEATGKVDFSVNGKEIIVRAK